jgi:DNA-binding transcriptional LysR family regulator
VAAPGYLAAHGTPAVPEDLARHRCLHYGHSTSSQSWQLRSAGKVLQVPIHACLCSNNGEVLRAAAINGSGITMLPTFIVGPDLQAGRLQVVMCDYPAVDLSIYALYAQRKYLAAKTRAFVDFLVKRFGDEPEWDGHAPV